MLQSCCLGLSIFSDRHASPHICPVAKPMPGQPSSELINSVLSSKISLVISPTCLIRKEMGSVRPVGELPSTDSEPTVIVRRTSSRRLEAAEGCRCGDKIPYRSVGVVAMLGVAVCGSYNGDVCVPQNVVASERGEMDCQVR
jgi:hypothetical protein